MSLIALVIVDLSAAIEEEEEEMEDWMPERDDSIGGCGLRRYYDPLVAARVNPATIKPFPYPLVSLEKQVERAAALCSKRILRDICVRNCYKIRGYMTARKWRVCVNGCNARYR